jgi:raffinose/stachyose/melibiose transport system permease protein
MEMYRYRWTSFLRELAFLALGAVFLIPVYFLVIVALKPTEEVAVDPMGFPHHLTLSGFSEAWTSAGSGGLGGALISSALVTICAVVLLLAIGIPCAYVVVRRPSKLAASVAGLLLLGIILPYQLGILPLYSAMNSVGLVGSRLGVIVVYVGQLTPFTVFLLTGFIRKLPRDYEEAAQVDGAGPLRTLLGTVVPLLRPGIATVAILDSLIVWNDFFVPVIWLNGAEHVTVPVAIFSFVGEFSSQWNLVFAGILIAVVPVLVLYLFTQRYLIRGFASGVRG